MACARAPHIQNKLTSLNKLFIGLTCNTETEYSSFVGTNTYMGTIKIIKVIFNTLFVYQDNIGVPGLGFCTTFLTTTGIGVFKYKVKKPCFEFEAVLMRSTVFHHTLQLFVASVLPAQKV